VDGCIFTRNSAVERGGAIQNYSSNPTLDNCTFACNSADVGGGIYNHSDPWGTSSPMLSNCILWGNSDESGTGQDAQIRRGSPVVNYSCVQGWTGDLGGVGNMGDDPLFADSQGPDGVPGTDDDDLRLQLGSPGIDAGDPDVAPAPGGTDLDGRPRILCGRVDMGAYESGIGDFDCDGLVDLGDFAEWTGCMTGPDAGPYQQDCEAFDFEFDGDVDLRDFAGFQALFVPPLVPGDLDYDGDVDTDDYAVLADCTTGPCEAAPCDPPLYDDPDCAHADLDADGDLDLADFAHLQRLFTGS